MNVKMLSWLVVFSLLTAVAHQEARAENQQKKKPSYTILTIKGMHCASCANRITKAMQKVKGVAKVTIDVKKGVGVVLPQDPKKLPSPRAQWEAVEKAGFHTALLVGPYGKFDKKPRF